MKGAKEAVALSGLAKVLAALASHLEPGEAAGAATEAAGLLTQAMKDANSRDDLPDLARSMAALAPWMSPAEAARAAAPLVKALEGSSNGSAQERLAQALAALAARMGPAEAVRAVASLRQAMKGAKNSAVLSNRALALAALVSEMEPGEAARAAGGAAGLLTQAMKDANSRDDLPDLARSMAALAPRMEPGEAARAAGGAAAPLLEAMRGARDSHLGRLAEVLAALLPFMEKGAAALAAGEAAPLLTGGMKTSRGGQIAFSGFARPFLAKGLSALAPHLVQAAAAREAREATAQLTEAMNDARGERALFLGFGPASRSTTRSLAAIAPMMDRTENNLYVVLLAEALAELAGRMEPGEASRVKARVALAVVFADPMTGPQPLGGAGGEDELRQIMLETLAKLLSGEPPVAPRPHAAAALVGAHASPVARAAILAAVKPVPRCALTGQQLVELMKMPTCLPEARRLILDHLGNRYNRNFAGQWDFVRFATEQKLNLDFLSPPQRPDRAPDTKR
jgi:hypothetical protein